MTVILEGERAFYLGSAARLIDESREVAWAEKYVSSQPDLKWLVANFVEADNPNGNGHIFPLADLRSTYKTIEHKPLNFLHHDHQVVGVNVGAELLEPGGEQAAAGAHPHVETVAGFYHYYFPKLFDEVVEPAHKQGSLFVSMEAVPKTLTCRGVGADAGCGREYAYKGRIHDSYCNHLNSAGSRKTLNLPHFTASAIIVPPVRPGWARADVTELSQLDKLIEHNLQEAQMAYDQIAVEFPHLDPRQWELMMAQLLAASRPDGLTTVTTGVGHSKPAPDRGGNADIGVPVDVNSGRTGPPVDTWEDQPHADNDADDIPSSLQPDGSWMVLNRDDLAERIQRASSDGNGIGVVRQHLMRRAASLGAMDLIPKEWHDIYPDWQRMDAGLVSNRGLLASLGFGLHDDYDLDYEIARDFTSSRRADLARKGLAIPVRNDKGEIVGGRYPIVTTGDLRNAVKAIGRAAAGAASEVKAFIKKRAVSLGATAMLPDGWSS